MEIGGGNAVHGGVNAELSFSRTKTGKWTERNNVEQNTLFTDANLGLYEGVYFKQGGEKTAETDMNYFNNVINGFQPVRLGLLEAGAETYLTKDLTTKYGATKVISNNGRAGRVRRNEAVNVLKASEASVMGLETSIKTYQLNDFSSFYSSSGLPTAIARAGGNYKDHHISEISTLRDDGARYVYGIPVYNNINKEVTFAVEPSISASNYDNGLVTYGGTDNTSNNTKGLDNFFDSQKMDPYAHAFLLTGVLSSDYVDKTLNGPTRDDLGKYTKFNYTRYATNYRWRSPYGVSANAASLNQALYSSSGAAGDDKASYSYGEKELWYMHSIETKNYVAVFELEDRQDALGVLGENGGKDPAQKTQRLKEIRLYTKQELIDKAANAVPLKVVHFEYDYSLCPGIHNSSTNLGKLTLKKVWFSYQKSWKGKLSPYVFEYNTANTATNYSYNPKAYDRWGNYKPNSPSTVLGGYGGTNSTNTYLLSSEFPYTDQNTTTANLYAAAWNLSRITLPSGAQLNVSYEADDYAFVQNKKAMQMFTVAGADNVTNSANLANVNLVNKLYDLNPYSIKDCIYLNLTTEELNEINAITLLADKNTFIRNKYFRDENGNDIDYMYFKFLVNVERNLGAYNTKYEYISGYAKINFGTTPTIFNNKLVFKVSNVNFYDNIPSSLTAHPVSMAGINFVRRYMPRVAFDNNQDPFSSAGSNLLALAQGMKAAFTPIVQFFKGGLSNALRLSKASQLFVPSRSFVRLYSGRQFKKGGGSRVQRILLSDNWSTQSTNPAISDANYGQIYDYVTKDTDGRTISSGVASYEPLIGGDENPFRRPVFYEEKHILAPDDDYYHEEPYGEAMFPGPVVGYSRVLVRNLQNINGSVPVSRHATGAIVHEFYTAKDFPTKTDRTDLKKIRHKPNPIAKAFKFSVRDFMTTSQGYQIVLNDMHGKQKAQWVYKEANSASLLIGTSRDDYYGNNYISGIEYKYKRNLDDLSNDVPVIEKTGQLATAMVGVDYDMVVDTRESLTTTRNGTTQGNLEAFLLAIFPGLVPTVFPGYSQEKTRYRSAVVTKVLYRYGLVDEIISYNDGASVSVKNKLWDAETGEILLTQTANNFSDPMYNFTYPAHWAYDRMGNAAKNSNAQSAITSGNVSTPSILIVGDEVLLYGSANARGWVKATQPTVQIIDNTGATMNLSSFTSLSVIRSGNRNQQNMPVAQLVSLENPLQQNGNVTNLVINKGTKVINAGASEYKDGWGIFCNCGITASSVVNPFLTGQAGIFRANASYVYLTGREQTKKNDNTNIRKDGPYLSFASFWQPNTSAAPYNWIKTTDPAWQYTNKTTLYSPYGFELENIDALNRSSAAIYGYGNTLPIAVSSNAKYKQIAFDGFEDYDYNTPCDDSRFTFMGTLGSGSNPTIQYYNFSTYNFISKPNSQNQKYAHTGRKSFKVQPSGTVITNQINPNYICTPATTPYFHK